MQRRLVLLHRQHVVRFGIDDGLRDFRLAAHGVDGHQRARDFEDFEELGDRRDLVTLRIDDHLTQADVVGSRPGADHVNGRLAAGGVKAAAKGLAVDGHDLACGDFVQVRNPTEQTRLELGWLDRPQNRIEPIMRWDAASQIEKLRQPFPLLAAVCGDGNEIVSTADDRAYGNCDHVDERVEDLAPSRVGQLGKMVLDASRDFLGHGDRPDLPRLVPRKPSGETHESHCPIHTRLPIIAQSPWVRMAFVGASMALRSQLAIKAEDIKHRKLNWVRYSTSVQPL